ncbi:hypothetical protein NRS6107_21165 (plasmid) [Bacillus subtilis]|uniref:hypothetical protein n=1 Tax=Bacillus subtilis TaxID=1423 RepID=UPI001B8F9E02|nr:hypothetical protein [Bacillus subtilis]CAF1785014.1 hypothetical protein NRS6107_04061 [Bacillus subtilis]CAI6329678.1 hypothetical protein NRS6107_21165 [Bacillus subtilis]
MKTCSYCGTPVHKKEHLYYCNFCLMYLEDGYVEEDGERININYREYALESDLDKPTFELMDFPTIELLSLLKIARNKRSSQYDNLSNLNKALEQLEDPSEYAESQKECQKKYEFFTKKMYSIENILKQRLGYIPPRIDKALLVKYLNNMKRKTKNQEKMKVFSSEEA